MPQPRCVGSFAELRSLVMTGLIAVFLGCAVFADEPNEKKASPAALPWLGSVDAGLAQAQRRGQPVLVRAGSEACPWCRKLEEEIAKPDVQGELGRWTLVAFDVKRSPGDARSQLVDSVPALRVLTPAGRLIAKQDGYLPADQLIAFLRQHHARAAVQAGDLPRTGVDDLANALKDRDPAVREAAVRGLLAQTAAAPKVVAVFRQGGLQARLAALELLREWQAPVAELDPWRPETLTPTRLAALERWGANPVAPRPPELTARERQEVTEDIQRLVQASAAEAAAIRERLVRRGSAILPQVAARLKEAGTDQARERLTALRYRLAANDRLALDWPGGFDRLASTQASVRQQAAQDLAKRAAPGDEPVLLELFTNPDPLVREISLRALHDLAGPQATAALAHLLADPEPNVRAAVLKQLAESPSASMVARIADYLKAEKDPDLVVHAVRVLRAAGGHEAMRALKQLTADPSWRVRAETAEALGELVGRERDRLPEDLKQEMRQEFVRLLEDRDGFVVGRAIGALQRMGLGDAIDTAVAAAVRHPETTPAILQLLSSDSEMRPKVIPHLRKFCRHEQPDVRALAITHLCAAAEAASEPELRAALADKSSAVRKAAAAALFNLLDSQREQYQPKPGAMQALLSAFTRPVWHRGLSGPLEPMLKSESGEERFWAALALIAVGKPAGAPPVALEVARTDRDLRMQAGRALPWLPWIERADFFQKLMVLALPPEGSMSQLEHFSSLVRYLTVDREPRALPLLWDLASQKGFTEAHVRPLTHAILGAHYGSDSNAYRSRVYMSRGARHGIEGDTKEVVQNATERAGAGPEMQRFVALVVLHTADPSTVGAVARPMIEDEATPARLRERAFQIQLLSQDAEAADQAAKEALTSKATAMRRTAVTYFAQGARGLGRFGDHLFLDAVSDRDSMLLHRYDRERPRLIVPKPPAALALEMLQPLRDDPDPAIAAQVAYLHAVFGDAGGLNSLVRHWREREKDSFEWKRLVFRAIAVLDDDSKVPVLQEIYRTTLHREVSSYPDDNVREFYWTIRIMQGPSALRLRKQIREDVGFFLEELLR
jgi:HEAT repeat protein